jgi:hypothetical protein
MNELMCLLSKTHLNRLPMAEFLFGNAFLLCQILHENGSLATAKTFILVFASYDFFRLDF